MEQKGYVRWSFKLFHPTTHGKCHICVFLVTHRIYNDIMTGLLIGMRAYVNCVCRLLRFWGENSKVHTVYINI